MVGARYKVSMIKFIVLIFLLLCFVNCAQKSSALVYEKKRLSIGNQTLVVEVADTDEKRRNGLMHRKGLASNAGMIFVYDKEKTQNFWMKNTYIDLDLGFFNKDRVLVDIQQMDGLSSSSQEDIPRVSSRFPAQFALEVNQGWFQEQNINLGESFILEPLN